MSAAAGRRLVASALGKNMVSEGWSAIVLENVPVLVR